MHFENIHLYIHLKFLITYGIKKTDTILIRLDITNILVITIRICFSKNAFLFSTKRFLEIWLQIFCLSTHNPNVCYATYQINTLDCNREVKQSNKPEGSLLSIYLRRNVQRCGRNCGYFSLWTQDVLASVNKHS